MPAAQTAARVTRGSRFAFAPNLGAACVRVAAGAAELVVVTLALATAVFALLRVVPGDPTLVILGDQASGEERHALRAMLHLDESIQMQYAIFLRGLVTFDFGHSLRRPGVSAAARVMQALGPTCELALAAVFIGACWGIGAAVLGAGPWLGRRRVWIARISLAVASTPLISFAPVVTYLLAARWRALPLPGDADAHVAGVAFASVILALPLGAHVARVTTAALTDLQHAHFLAVARAKGASHARTLWVHAVAAVTGPIVMVVATQLGALFGGAVVLERLFEREGLGTLLVEAYASRDLPVLEAAVIAAGALFVAVQQLAAGANALFDPRVGR